VFQYPSPVGESLVLEAGDLGRDNLIIRR